MTPHLIFLARARGDLGAQLAHAATNGFGRAVGSMLAHGLGLPVAGGALLFVVLAGVARRHRPAPRRARRR